MLRRNALLASAAALALAAAAPAAAEQKAEEPTPAAVSATYSAAELIGDDVVNEAGEPLGEIHDLVLDAEGRVTTAVLSVGGVLGIGDKLVGEPFTDLEIAGPDTVVIAATSEELERRPAFAYDMVGAELAPAAYEQRDDYVDRWTGRMSNWSERVENRAAEASEEAEGRLSAAWSEVEARWAELKDASAETWDRAVASFEQAYGSFKRTWSDESESADANG